jgi:hypothetical protein
MPHIQPLRVIRKYFRYHRPIVSSVRHSEILQHPTTAKGQLVASMPRSNHVRKYQANAQISSSSDAEPNSGRGDGLDPSLMQTADIILRQTKGKQVHDKFHIDQRGRSSAVGCNASDGQAAF